jgi:hypothetical protein
MADSGYAVKRACTYLCAFLIGVLAIEGGFYLIPIYKHAPSGLYSGPISIIVSYFLLGIPPVALFLKIILRNNWKRVIASSFAIVLGNIIVLSTFTFFILHSAGKL